MAKGRPSIAPRRSTKKPRLKRPGKKGSSNEKDSKKQEKEIQKKIEEMRKKLEKKFGKFKSGKGRHKGRSSVPISKK